MLRSMLIPTFVKLSRTVPQLAAGIGQCRGVAVQDTNLALITVRPLLRHAPLANRKANADPDQHLLVDFQVFWLV